MWFMVKDSLSWNSRQKSLHNNTLKRGTEVQEMKLDDIDEDSKEDDTKEKIDTAQTETQDNKQTYKQTYKQVEGIKPITSKFTQVHGKALLTTTIVTSFFLVTWIPTLIRYFMASWPFSIVIPPTALDRAMPLTFSLGSWLNPLIYTVINKGFRDFIKGKVKVRIAALTNTISQ